MDEKSSWFRQGQCYLLLAALQGSHPPYPRVKQLPLPLSLLLSLPPATSFSLSPSLSLSVPLSSLSVSHMHTHRLILCIMATNSSVFHDLGNNEVGEKYINSTHIKFYMFSPYISPFVIISVMLKIRFDALGLWEAAKWNPLGSWPPWSLSQILNPN